MCNTQAGRQAALRVCVPHTVQLTFITHRFAYICVSCNNNNNCSSEWERQLLGHVYNCQLNACLASIVSLCVCVHVSCIICHAARLPFDRLLCAPKLFKFDFSLCMYVCQAACLCAWLITKLLPTLLRSPIRSRSRSLSLWASVVPCWLSYMCGICFYSLEHKILWRWKPERMLQNNKRQEARGVYVFRPNAKYPREISWIFL